MQNWMVRDQLVVVAGGSNGIGLGTVRALASRGARVVALARNEERLQAAVREIGSDSVVGIAADVCDRAGLDAVYQQIWDRFGRLDAVINNVGYQFIRRIELMPPAEVHQLIELNLVSTIFGCQAAIPYLRRNGSGRIINISSASVRDPNEFSHIGVYSACKAAVDHFTASLRREVAPDGILVTLFSSGSVFSGSVHRNDPEALAEGFKAWFDTGPYYGGSTTPEIMGTAIAGCLEYPPGIAPEFIEVKPGVRTHKALEP